MRSFFPLTSFVVLAILAGCTDHRSVATRPEGAPVARAGDRQAPLYDIELLYADYAANRQAAESKYRGSVFFATGRMQRAFAEPAGRTTLYLKAEDPARPVPAQLRPRQACGPEGANTCTAYEAVSSLLRGAKVYLECTGGDTRDGLPELVDCALVPAGDKIDVK